jgi:hypothetical protein
MSAKRYRCRAAVVNNPTVFAGSNLDTLGLSDRLGDNMHLNDTGMARSGVIGAVGDACERSIILR